MSSKLNSTVAAIALAAMLGSGMSAFAQTAPATEAPTAPATTAPATEAPATPAPATLPEILRNPIFTDVTTEPARRGNLTMVKATLADGTELRGVIDAEGNLTGLSAPQGTALPQIAVDALMPENLRGNAFLSNFATISAIGSRDGAVMIGGQDAAGQQVRAGFDAEGQLMRFGRNDGERRGPGFHGERSDRGERGEHRRERGEQRGDRGDRRERGAETRAPIDEAAIRATLEAAGYTRIDDIERSRRGIKADAVNPQGQEVELTLNESGEIIRERLDD
ncbi:MAG: hypothetical protein Q4G36_08440 [Paracoccus sp. (in: a-proteobacteria)]|nr:hypothetical protein [Paracoccus sp. (in: a-proteobacteria)]